ncbi:MAG: C-terminal binding protein [Atopobiaceae bacterium]|nr:C-terminal binding protein [Atopobiaceae bacterium]
MYRVLYYKPEGAELLFPAVQELERQGLTKSIELVPCAHELMAPPDPSVYEGIDAIIAEFSRFYASDIEAAAHAGVRLVASMSIGVNHIDVDAASQAGVLVSSCPGYCSGEVATHTLGLMLNLMRQIGVGHRHVLDGGWDPHVGNPMHRIRGQVTGLVFFGRIARELAPMLQALGMKVLVWAPTKSESELSAARCEKVDTLDELLVRSDVVSLHCPLIDETRGLIGARELSLMKPTAYLINTTRGDVVDEDALLAALEAGQIQGAGLDVLRKETNPDKRNQALVEHPRVIVTPHSAYLSVEAEAELVSMSIDAVRELLVEGRVPTNAVNPEAFDRSHGGD